MIQMMLKNIPYLLLTLKVVEDKIKLIQKENNPDKKERKKIVIILNSYHKINRLVPPLNIFKKSSYKFKRLIKNTITHMSMKIRVTKINIQIVNTVSKKILKIKMNLLVLT